MYSRRAHSTEKLTLERGLPPHDFLAKAWASEPLSNVLNGTNIAFALPEPDEDISLIAKDEEKVIGQCSTNRVVKYWNHVDVIGKAENLSTEVFVKIHKKAVADEKKYLQAINQSEELAFHSAGIAVLPDYRGLNLGQTMREKQIAICVEQQATTLFCETTNRFSAATVEQFGFFKIAVYSYKDLAVELESPDLNRLKDDSFSVWCRRI